MEQKKQVACVDLPVNVFHLKIRNSVVGSPKPCSCLKPLCMDRYNVHMNGV